jgi:hypothetical protein
MQVTIATVSGTTGFIDSVDDELVQVLVAAIAHRSEAY